jgi:putative FmdB family regulatory protein
VPIYEYACQKCGHELEALQKVSDPVLRKCPACGALRLKRLVSAPQFRLKGTGWYETDFKKDGKKRVLDGGDAPAADAGESGKADASARTEASGKTDGKDAAAKPGKKEPATKKKPGTPASKPAAAD